MNVKKGEAHEDLPLLYYIFLFNYAKLQLLSLSIAIMAENLAETSLHFAVEILIK